MMSLMCWSEEREFWSEMTLRLWTWGKVSTAVPSTCNYSARSKNKTIFAKLVMNTWLHDYMMIFCLSVPGEHKAYDAAGWRGTLKYIIIMKGDTLNSLLANLFCNYAFFCFFSRVKMLESELWLCWMNKEVTSDLSIYFCSTL